MDRRELAGYVVASVGAVLAPGCAPSPARQDPADVLAVLDELLDGAPVPRDFDYAHLRESITIAVCVKVLARRGIPVTYDQLERIGEAVMRPPRPDA
ncbi:MAG: hypothetical protein M3Q10_10395 [Chloroflexota bacterium]|nr:hypothetical protein [Chloroflexota bacterium]